MAIDKIGVNLTEAQNIEPLNISVDTTNIINEVVMSANESTNHMLAYFILFALVIVFYFSLSDKTQLGSFGYSDARAAAISFGICSTFGITLMSVNFITNFKAVAMFIIIYMILSIYVLMYENKE